MKKNVGIGHNDMENLDADHVEYDEAYYSSYGRSEAVATGCYNAVTPLHTKYKVPIIHI